jgi:pyruvate/2-oxoglutarate dehydrogenase complex dihydrolipoamide dehydrogenase (E3) component
VGRKTALIEREHVGGTCINEGCTPTKTMVASALLAYLALLAHDAPCVPLQLDERLEE